MILSRKGKAKDSPVSGTVFMEITVPDTRGLDKVFSQGENDCMPEKPFTVVPAELRAEFEDAIRRAMSGRRDPEAMRKACEHMDSVREQIRQQFGVQDIGVDLIRELRGELET
jgi:hypothetical protein